MDDAPERTPLDIATLGMMAEERAQRAEAEVERLRAALRARAHRPPRSPSRGGTMWYQVTFQIRVNSDSEKEVRDLILDSSLSDLMNRNEHWTLDVRNPPRLEPEGE